MNSVGTYRTKPSTVRAVRWLGAKNCEAVFAFLGWPHGPHHNDHDTGHIEIAFSSDSEWAEIGDWIVQVEPQEFKVLTGEEFLARYEADADAAVLARPALREVTQWFLAGDDSGIPGDCVRAAVASLLDREPTSVPHFIVGSDMDSRVWWYALKGWAVDNGWRVDRRAVDTDDALPDFGLAIGQSSRGVSHAVVAVDGKVAWDPHPSREGLVDVRQIIEFTPAGSAPARFDQPETAGHE